jgi:hypothetical protein
MKYVLDSNVGFKWLVPEQDCELLTADDKLIKNLQPTFPFITSLASLP